jgi:galactonate dehydratase
MEPEESQPARPAGDNQTIISLDTYLVDGGWRNFVIVKIVTSEGIVGWGDATLGGKEHAVAALLQTLAKRYVLRSSPFAIEAVWQRATQAEFNLGPVMYAALAGIETAMWDVAGKICGQPVANLLGGAVRPSVRAYANGWYSGSRDVGRLRDEARRALELGYDALKFDPFGSAGREISRSELAAAVTAVEVVRDEAGSADVLVEFHGRFSVGSAIEAIRAVADYRPLFCEEPVPPYNVDAQAMVTDAAGTLGVRVATGEHVYAAAGFTDLIAKRAAHVVQPDLVYSGGMLETMKIAALAETQLLSVAPHNCDGTGRLAALVQLSCNIPNFMILESFEHFDVPWRSELYIGGPTFSDGSYLFPTSPGWGYEVNEAVALAHPGSRDATMNMFADGWERRMSNVG